MCTRRNTNIENVMFNRKAWTTRRKPATTTNNNDDDKDLHEPNTHLPGGGKKRAEWLIDLQPNGI